MSRVLELTELPGSLKPMCPCIAQSSTGAPDSEELEIETACILDAGFVVATKLIELVLGNGAIGNVDVLFGDVDVAKEMFVHEVPVRVERFLDRGRIYFGNGVVLIEVEGDDVAEG